MSPEELDEARAKEADRLWGTAESRVGELSALQVAARLARENWTPPEPVDPDVLAFREWLTTCPLTPRPAGDPNRYDGVLCETFLAGARMAREQERERADMPIGMAGALVDRCQRLLHSLPAGVHAHLDVKWGLDALARAIEAEIAKYRGEA